MARFGFDVNSYEPDSGSYEPISDGEYQLMCEEAEERKTKAGTGAYIRAKFRVLGPTNANRVIFQNFNIHNPSSKAEEIGRKQLAGWARACGRPNVNDTDELLNLAFSAEVGTEPGSGDYGPQNVIRGFKAGAASAPAPARAPAAAAKPPAASPAPAPAPAAAKPAAGKKAPWDE
jgi:hypothetical protein